MPHPWEIFAKMMRDQGWADNSRGLDPQSRHSFYLEGYFRGSYELIDQYLRGETEKDKGEGVVGTVESKSQVRD